MLNTTGCSSYMVGNDMVLCDPCSLQGVCQGERSGVLLLTYSARNRIQLESMCYVVNPIIQADGCRFHRLRKFKITQMCL